MYCLILISVYIDAFWQDVSYYLCTVNVMKYFCCVLAENYRRQWGLCCHTAFFFLFFLGCKSLRLSCRSYLGDHFWLFCAFSYILFYPFWAVQRYKDDSFKRTWHANRQAEQLCRADAATARGKIKTVSVSGLRVRRLNKVDPSSRSRGTLFGYFIVLLSRQDTQTCHSRKRTVVNNTMNDGWILFASVSGSWYCSRRLTVTRPARPLGYRATESAQKQT